jgi:outer membrane protein OmpA-like peptidoglycan-associated protein
MLAVLSLLALVAPAPTAQGEVTAEAPLAASGPAIATDATSDGLSRRRDRKWIHRWAPERNVVELGVYGGIIIPARDLELFKPSFGLPRQGFRPLGKIAPDLGGRVGYFPIRYFGIELEGGAMPTKAGGERATMWTARGHLVGQLGLWSVTPFVVVGAGAIGVSSPRTAVGNDVDASLHVGLGAKFYINRYLMLRLDLRDVITARRGVAEGATNTIEALLGLSVTLGRKRDRDPIPTPVEPPPLPADRDGDGVLDTDDQCIDVPGDKPTGCPPPGDRDGDGFTDDVDACVDVPGIAPDGCPDPDPDKDGILGTNDACPDVAETKNGFEDTDGCPDEVPTDFAGLEVLEGVFFPTNEDTLGKTSIDILDRAVAALQKHPSVRVEISGHTDSTGNRQHNMDLSQRRAEAVKRYLVEHGIDASRMETRGAGPDEPLDSNSSNAGRAKNRRIEFRVLK